MAELFAQTSLLSPPIALPSLLSVKRNRASTAVVLERENTFVLPENTFVLPTIVDSSPISLDEHIDFLRRWALLHTREQLNAVIAHVPHQALCDALKNILKTAPPAIARNIGAALRQVTEVIQTRRCLQQIPSVSLPFSLFLCTSRSLLLNIFSLSLSFDG
jgi:hypothetical protein